MKKLTSRFVALVMALILCMSFSVNAFAMESSDVDNGVSTASVGDLLYSKSTTFSNSCTITITTTSGNWDANFYVQVSGNSDASYYVCMTAANGNQYMCTATSGSGKVNIADLTYAKAGDYTFYFLSWDGNTGSATASAYIYD